MSNIDHGSFQFAPNVPAQLESLMSERSTCFRDQAAKCRWHADQMTDAGTQEQLRTLATEYIMRAVALESEEPHYGMRQ